ncbi:hypothetical protein CDAR_124671 [Caerostris darwini]|uniref:Uncharacterized protein n=1 Tax=Caerostris darwini TaxID=1538125 RepID=A0AAV4RNK4_9ARAC|nr:hypothetical protein CDAR_124671 [Caerostris darwini]
MTPNKERGCQGDGLPYKARGGGVIKVQAELLAAAVVPSVLCHWSGWAVSLRVQSTEVVLRFYESTCTLAPATRSWLNFGAGRQKEARQEERYLAVSSVRFDPSEALDFRTTTATQHNTTPRAEILCRRESGHHPEVLTVLRPAPPSPLDNRKRTGTRTSGGIASALEVLSLLLQEWTESWMNGMWHCAINGANV